MTSADVKGADLALSGLFALCLYGVALPEECQ